ncbi:glutamine-hydrolyzing carbamoyl-phosphate synthase small subunit [candidate division KSB1 bacterium]
MKKELIPATLKLEDGSEFTGWSFGFKESTAGEVVFNTAMTGYPESLTDPSYKGQILVLTYPLVGNYGVPEWEMENGLMKYYESEHIHISGLVISDYSFSYSHWNAKTSLAEWLTNHNIPALFGVDTRAITQLLREKGTALGAIIINGNEPTFYDPNDDNLVAKVSIREKKIYGNGKYRIVLVDCGVKNNIIRNLIERDFTVIRVPWDYDYHQENYDGLFISNGPGDPKQCIQTIDHIKKSLDDKKPVFGICLGSQLLGLGSGADTYKLKYGHRSHNQPVIKAGTTKAYITSQNHGFAVDNRTVNEDWEPLFVNLNDKTNEGLKHKKKPFFSTQFHPEASGGPSDTMFLFDEFYEMVKQCKER